MTNEEIMQGRIDRLAADIERMRKHYETCHEHLSTQLQQLGTASDVRGRVSCLERRVGGLNNAPPDGTLAERICELQGLVRNALERVTRLEAAAAPEGPVPVEDLTDSELADEVIGALSAALERFEGNDEDLDELSENRVKALLSEMWRRRE